MTMPEIVFKGVPRAYTRGYTAEVIRRQEPERVVIPCVGAFALASTVIEAGVDPSNIQCCDITLYSTVIGRMLSGDDMPLEAKGEWDWLNEYMEDSVGKVAAVTVAIRLLQYLSKRDSVYKWERVREVRERKDVYLMQARQAAVKMRDRLGGLSYQAEDMWGLIARHVPRGDDRDSEGKGGTLILCNPPRYSKGYSVQYKGVEDAFEWQEPRVQQFDEEDYPMLMDTLRDGPRALMYYATPVISAEDPAEQWGPPWKSVFADRPKTGKTAAINWIVSNRPYLAAPSAKLRRADVEAPVRAKYKMFREGLITPESRLEVRVESKEVAGYYRDLLVHNLGLINAERYKVLLMDGELMAVMGAHLQNLRASGVLNGICKLTFSFTVDHPVYNRLHKLTLMSAVSSWFWEHEISDMEKMPRAIQTTMMTPHPEVKTARGIFKLRDRERDPVTGWNRLTYYADLVYRSPEETLAEWKRRFGQEGT